MNRVAIFHLLHVSRLFRVTAVHPVLAFALAALGCWCWVPAAGAQVAPVLTSVSPNVLSQGQQATLTLTGLNFGRSAQVVFSDRDIVVNSTIVQSSSLLTAMVTVSPAALVGAHIVDVFNTATLSTQNTRSSGTVTVVAAAPGPVPPPPGPAPGPTPAILLPPSPTLNSISPGSLAQGSQQVRIMLTGTNFRPGAQVVLGGSDAGVTVTTTAVLNSSQMVALVTTSPRALTGLRTVDVINLDGTSTRAQQPTRAGAAIPGTTKSLLVVASNSLAAPLNVQTLVLTSPRDGSVATQSDELYGTAIVAGTGTGVVTGEWLWDDAVSEQFTARLIGGQSTTLRTSHTLPTLQIGLHKLSLRMTEPNLMQSKTVTVMVNPGNWQELRLLLPKAGTSFSSDSPPILKWTIVPGVAKYQVGFSARPYFNSIDQWYDVTDTNWQPPAQVWGKLPSEVYWTVRAVEVSGETRQPARLRRIQVSPPDALKATSTQPGVAPSGAPLLQWKPLERPAYYGLTISSDPEFVNVVRRYLTPLAHVDLHMAQSRLKSGQTYYWQVEAFSPNGRRLIVGPVQSFVASGAAQARINSPLPYLVAAAGAVPPPPSLAERIASRQPEANSSVTEARPPLAIEFKEALPADQLAISLDDTDVTAMVLQEGARVSYRPFFPLPDGTHKVTIELAGETESWQFTVLTGVAKEPAGESGEAHGPPKPESTNDAEAEPPPTGTAASTPPVAVTATQVGLNTQWVSGGEADTGTLNLAQQATYEYGKWKFEMNGTGLLNSLYSPNPQHAIGRFNNYVARATYNLRRWGADLRFGILSPSIFTGSEFVTVGTARQGFDPSVRTPAGNFGFFASTDDALFGSGTGVSFRQKLMGAGYTATLPNQRAELRLMWLNARDEGIPTTVAFDPFGQPLQFDQFGSPVLTPAPMATASSGDIYGGLLRVNLWRNWVWTSEYSWSYNHVAIADPSSLRRFGRGWKSGVQGSVWNAALTFHFHDVGPNFGSPANPGLTAASTPDRRGLDASVSRPFKIGSFTLGYQFLQNNLRNATLPGLDLHNLTFTWTRTFQTHTAVSLQLHETRTQPGSKPAAFLALPPDQQFVMLADTRTAGFTGNVMQSLGRLSITITGARDWFRNRLVSGQNVITSAINSTADWNASQVFRLQSNVGINFVNNNPLTVGATRVITTFIQPMLMWPSRGLQFSTTFSGSKSNGQLKSGSVLADQWTVQYAGRLSWQMPGHFKFSTLALEAGQTRVRDVLFGTDRTDPRVFLIWNLTWGYNHGAAVAQ